MTSPHLAPHRTASRRGGVAGALATLLVLLLGAQAWAQGPTTRVAIRDVSLTDGQVELIAAVSPDVTEAEVLAGLAVYENNVRVEDATAEFVARTQIVDTPAEVALLLDTSGSTADNQALDQAKIAATDFVARLTAQDIPVTLITFSTSAVVQVRRSTDNAALAAAIAAASPGGETALYDAVDAAVTALSVSTAEQRELVLFTDGGDTASVGSTPEGQVVDRQAVLAEVAGRAAAEGLAITAVSLTTTETDAAALTSLATTTGGVVLAVGNTAQLGQTLGQVASSIASQLVVRWTVLDDTAPNLEAHLVLNLPRGTSTSPTWSVDNPNAAEPGSGIPVQPPAIRVTVAEPILDLGGATLPLALGSGAVATGILGFLVFAAPANRRSSRVLKRQMAEQTRRRRDQPVEELAVRERVAQLLESVPKPTGYDERIQAQLERAAWPLRTSEFVGMRVGLASGGLIVGWAIMTATHNNPAKWVLPLVLAVVGWLAPGIILEQRRKRRVQAFHEQMADTLQMLAGSLRAGYGLMQGIDNVSNEGQAPTSTEFGRVLTEVRLGISVEDALSAMAERIGSDDFRWVTVAIAIQRKVGGNLAELLDTVSSTLREREQVRRQVQVLSAEGRLSAWVLIALPIMFALYLSVTQPSYLAPMFQTAIGLGMLGGAVVLMTLGVLWIRKVVEIDV